MKYLGRVFNSINEQLNGLVKLITFFFNKLFYTIIIIF